MLSIEEYIAKRKKEDKLNEYEFDKRVENIKMCVDYVFEYFNGYLGINEADHKTVLNEERLETYRSKLRVYSKEVQDWLVGICNDYNKQINRTIGVVIEKNELFLLYNTDSEFRSVSYDCYTNIIKKLPFLKDQTEMLFLFIKDYHQVRSIKCAELNHVPFFNESISDWIDMTYAKYQVSIPAFIYSYMHKFCDDVGKWPKSHRVKGKDPDFPNDYDYDYKQQKNLFALDSLYPKISKKPFIRGRKQELELLMMYYWLHGYTKDDEYWEEYLKKTLPAIDE